MKMIFILLTIISTLYIINSFAQSNLDARSITSFIVDPASPNKLYAGTYGTGVFCSSNNGESWSCINNNLYNTWIYSIAIDPSNTSNIFAGSWKGIYKTTNSGLDWISVHVSINDLIPTIIFGDNGSSGKNIYAGWGSGVYRSTDSGIHWTNSFNGFGNNADVRALVVSPDSAGKLFAGTYHFDSTWYGAVYISRDYGSTWAPTNLKFKSITCVSVQAGSPQIIYAGTKGNGVYKSLDDGATWSLINNGLSSLNINALLVNPNIQSEVFAATVNGVFRSTNSGDSWIDISNDIINKDIRTLTIIQGSPNRIFAGTWGDGVFYSSNNGTNWVAANNGLLNENYRWNLQALPDTGNLNHYQRIYVDGNESWLLGARKIYHSYNYPDDPFEVIYENQNQYFALNDWVFRKDNNKTLAWAVGYSSLGARSTDTLGLNWTQMSLGGTSTYTCVTFPTDLIGYASGMDKRIHKTTNGGANWFDLNPGQPGPGYSTVNSLFYLSVDTGYVCTSDPRLAITTDGGFNWEDVGEIANGAVDIFFLNSNHGWAVGMDIHCYHNGIWTYVESPIDIGLNSVYFINENEGWAVGINGVILHTTDGGFTWTGQYCGKDEWLMDVYFSSPSNGYIVGYHGNIYHTTNGGAVFVEENLHPVLPECFMLFQNYPNPFNPVTSIQYAISSRQFVQLKVYDVLGNEVATLVSEEKPAGMYNVQFTMNNISSGIYFYQLKAGDYLETKKMIYLK